MDLLMEDNFLDVLLRGLNNAVLLTFRLAIKYEKIDYISLPVITLLSTEISIDTQVFINKQLLWHGKHTHTHTLCHTINGGQNGIQI